MSKFIVLDENLNLSDKENWYRRQDNKISNVLANVIPLNKYIIKDVHLNRKVLLEINDSDLAFFRSLNYTLYGSITDVPVLVPVDKIWDELTDSEKDDFLVSTEADVIRFQFDLQVRNFFNMNNQSFIDALNQLETLSIINENKAQYILNKYSL